MSLTFQLSEIHRSSPPKSMTLLDLLKIFSAPRFSPFRRIQLRTKQLQQRITSDLCQQLHNLISSTFITCNTTQCGQLWTAVNFPTYNPNKSASVITIVTSWHVQIMQLRRPRPYTSASMSIAQSSINIPSPPTKKGILLQRRRGFDS